MIVSKGAFENYAVVRDRDFRLLLGGQTVSVFGDRMVAVVLRLRYWGSAARRRTWGSCWRRK